MPLTKVTPNNLHTTVQTMVTTMVNENAVDSADVVTLVNANAIDSADATLIINSNIAAKSTSDLSEGSNLYYTNARADARVNLQTGANLVLSNKSTSDLSEGSNLYYTNARADARIAAATTSDLSEGTNKYYTTSRGDSDTGAYIAGNRTYGNITTTGYIAGPATMTIDPAAVGDNTGTLVVAGNLQVDGTTTTINSTTVAIDDLNFSIATDAASSAAANGAGITVGGAGATLVYTHATTSWDMNKPLNVTGTITATGVGGFNDYIDLNTSGNRGKIGYDSNNVYIGSTSSTGAIYFKNNINSTGAPQSSGDTKMVITDSGVGIGTTSPQGVLDLGATSLARSITWSKYNNVYSSYSEGSLNLTSNYYGNTSANDYKTSSTATYGAAGIEISGTGGTSNSGIIQFFVDPQTAKTADAAFVPTERMRIDSSGSLLINRTSKIGSEKLSVKGEIRAGYTASDNQVYLGVDSANAYLGTNASGFGLKFEANGSERMRISSSGFVGIGTSSPSALLHLSGSDPEIRLSDTTNANYSSIVNVDGNMIYKADAGNQFGNSRHRFEIDGSEAMRIDGSGNVGIGTNSPEDDVTKFGGSVKGLSVAAGQVAIAVRATSNAQYVGYLGQSGANTYLGGVGGGDMFFQTSTSGLNRMTIRSGGDVGIGTTSPAEKLEVNGSFKVGNLKIQNVNGGRIGFNRNTANGAIYDSNFAAFQINGAYSGADFMAFEAYTSGGVGTDAMVIKDNGYVGIGTTGPKSTLDTGYTRIYNSGAASSPSAGKGLEVHYVTSGRNQGEGAYLISYDRDNSAYKQFVVDANNIELLTGGSNRLSILSGGNVGIGVTNPGAKLDISGTGTAANPTVQIVTTNSDAFNHAMNAFNPNLTANEGNLIVVGKSGSTKNSGYVGYRYSGTSGSDENIVSLGHWGNNWLLNVKGNGNVGIGNTNPGYKLTVDNGTSDGGIFKLNNEEVGLNVSVNGSVGDYTNSTRMVVFNATRLDSGTSPKLRLGGQGGVEIAADANNVRMVVNGNGYVGIGTTSPGHKFTVSGTGGADSTLSIRSTTSGGNTVLYMYGANGADYWGMFTGSAGGGLTLKDETNAKDAFNARPQGKMAYPSQTRFTAFGTGGSTSYSASSPFVMQVVRNNINNRYNTSNGIFTADVAGYYQFRFNAYTYNSGQWSVLYWNGSSISSFVDTNGTTAGGDHTVLCTVNANGVYHMTWTMYLASGKGAAVGWRSGFSGSIYRSHAQFSGELISAD